MKTFKLEVILDDNKMDINTWNDGFNVLELIGILEGKKEDLLKQLSESTGFSRKYIDEDGNVMDISEKE